MTEQTLPKAIWTGKIELTGLTLEVAALDDGRRVITEDSVVAFLDWLASGPPTHEVEAAGLAVGKYLHDGQSPKT